MIITLKGISFSKPSCRLENNHYFILIGGSVKSFHKVDLTFLCKSLYWVHTSLYVCKSFCKVDLVVLIAPNSKSSEVIIVSLNMPTLYCSTKACGYHPHPNFTFYLEGFWVTKLCVKVLWMFWYFQLFMHTIRSEHTWRINW